MVCVRLAEQLLSDVHLSSPAFSVLVEGQGQFTQPPSDNYNLTLDPYRAASTFIVACAYVEVGVMSIDYTWAKDGVSFQPRVTTVGKPEAATVQAIVDVPNGDYSSSLKGTYTCNARVGGAARGSRNIIVTLPGKPSVHHIYLSRTVRKCLNTTSWVKCIV